MNEITPRAGSPPRRGRGGSADKFRSSQSSDTRSGELDLCPRSAHSYNDLFEPGPIGIRALAPIDNDARTWLSRLSQRGLGILKPNGATMEGRF